MYEINYKIIKERFPAIADGLAETSDTGHIEVIESKTGDMVPLVTVDGRKRALHSRFEPWREAERFIGEIDTEKHDLYLIFGFAFGYHVELLLKEVNEDALVLVIEKDTAILHEACAFRDLHNVFNDSRFMLALDPTEDDLSLLLQGKSSRAVTFLTHRGSHQLDPDYYANKLEVCRSYLSTKEVNIATLAKFEKIWSSNIARNINRFLRSPGVNQYYDKFSDYDAIVVAAGPTLNESIEFIRENMGRAVVVAVDTALKTLLKNGIKPHFCLAVDPQVVNARYFEGVDIDKTILVADPTVHPSVYRFFRGDTITTGVAFDLMGWIEDTAGERGSITHGGSVSTNAYDFAKRLGVRQVIMVGQDLAFTGGYAHVKGSYLDEQIHLRTTRTYTPEMFNRYQLTALPKIFVRGIRTPKVQTNQKMMIFNSWFERQRDPNLVNATPDGAYLNGVSHKDMKDITINEPEKEVEEFLSDLKKVIDMPDAETAGDKIQKKVESMLKELESLLPVLRRTVGFSENLASLMKNKKRDASKLDYILGKLAETDRIIESKKTIKDMISFTIQRVIHTITEGYEIDENDRSITEDELTAKRSLYLYKGLLEGALFNRKTLSKMNALLK